MAVSTERWRNATLTIANAGTETDELDLQLNGARRQMVMSILAPSALTGTVKVQKAGGTYRDLQSGGSDVNVTAGNSVTIDPLIGGAMKLVSSGAEGAERAFHLRGNAKS
jgi:hypothetical protein